MIERSYIGSGNVGRNTTIIRSNYMMDGNTEFFEFSLKLWEGLSHALNFNVMLSQRGQCVLAQGPRSSMSWPARATSCASTASTPSSSIAAR